MTKNRKSETRLAIDKPEPMAKEAYYGLAGEIVRFIEPHSEADPVALLVNLLTSFGSVIGSKPHYKVEADKHPMRLFAVLVGNTAKGRKGTSWNYLKNLFGSIDPEWKTHIQTGLSSGEGLIWAVRDKIEKQEPNKEKGKTEEYHTVIVDPGVQDKRLLVVESEFASLLKVISREGNTLSPVIRNAWDSGDLQSLTKNSPAKATGAHIAILGHITKEELLRYMSDTETANGFGNRFLLFWVERSKTLPFGGKFSEADFSKLVGRLREAVEFAKEVDEITWAEETRPLWEYVYPELSEGKAGLIGGMTGRSEAYTVRVACMYALLDRSIVIKPEHLLAALAVWDYVESSIRYIFQDRTGDPIANEILDALRNRPEGMTRTEINNALGRNIDSERIKTALETLQTLGRIKKEIRSPNGRDIEQFSLISLNSYASQENNRSGYLKKVLEFIEKNKQEVTK